MFFIRKSNKFLYNHTQTFQEDSDDTRIRRNRYNELGIKRSMVSSIQRL